jgi:amidase
MRNGLPHDGLGAFVPGAEVVRDGAIEGPLSGLNFAAKDIFDVAGMVTGCGNPDWARTHEPAEADAPAVAALLSAGARLIGKTITDELAYSLNGQNFHYGTPTNSNAPGRIPGGSSCGSAAAVAGGVTDTALGSDTGGSVRIPASYCGLFGLRPTHGRIPLDGVMPLAPSYDTVGWFARDAATLQRIGSVLLGEAEKREAQRLVVAVDALDQALPEARQRLAPVLTRLQQRLGGAEALYAGGEHDLEHWMRVFRVTQGHEIWRVHGEWITRTQPTFGPEIRERFEWAAGIDDESAAAAAKEREEFRARLCDRLADDERVLCLPTAPGIAPRLDADPETLREHRSRVLCLTCIAGLAGLPQISLPLASLSGCPLGISLIAGPGGDQMLLSFAAAFTGEDETFESVRRS